MQKMWQAVKALVGALLMFDSVAGLADIPHIPATGYGYGFTSGYLTGWFTPMLLETLLGAWLMSGLSSRPKALFMVLAGAALMLIGFRCGHLSKQFFPIAFAGLYGLHVLREGWKDLCR